jgi:hypothetical protein
MRSDCPFIPFFALHLFERAGGNVMFNPNVRPDSVLEAAVAHFKRTDNSFVVRSMSGIWEEIDNGYVVRICYGNTRPPRRAWFFVSSDAKSVVRMSEEEAKPYNKGTWR